MSYLRPDQSGALLVCAAIVSEVLHQKRHRLFVHQIRPGIENTHIYLEVDVLGEDRKDIKVIIPLTYVDKCPIIRAWKN